MSKPVKAPRQGTSASLNRFRRLPRSTSKRFRGFSSDDYRGSAASIPVTRSTCPSQPVSCFCRMRLRSTAGAWSGTDSVPVNLVAGLMLTNVQIRTSEPSQRRLIFKIPVRRSPVSGCILVPCTSKAAPELFSSRRPPTKRNQHGCTMRVGAFQPSKKGLSHAQKPLLAVIFASDCSYFAGVESSPGWQSRDRGKSGPSLGGVPQGRAGKQVGDAGTHLRRIRRPGLHLKQRPGFPGEGPDRCGSRQAGQRTLRGRFPEGGHVRVVDGRKVGGNVATYFCTADGRVLHAIAGPVDAGVLLREAKWVLDIHQKAKKSAKRAIRITRISSAKRMPSD